LILIEIQLKPVIQKEEIQKYEIAH